MRFLTKALIFTGFFSVFFSCSTKKEGEQKPTLLSNFLKITDSEDRGVKAVLATYGGYCSYSVGVSVDTRGENEKYFKLKLNKSNGLEYYEKYYDMLGPGICYTFFRELANEKTSYSSIRAQIEFNDGQEKSFEFSINELEKVQQKMQLVEDIVQVLKDRQFQKLKLYLDKQTVVKYNMDDFIKNVIKIEEVSGSVQSFMFLGFSIDKTENDVTLLKVAGLLKRNNQNNPIKIEMDLNSNLNQVFNFDFTFD
jgi:hypothetical protein